MNTAPSSAALVALCKEEKSPSYPIVPSAPGASPHQCTALSHVVAAVVGHASPIDETDSKIRAKVYARMTPMPLRTKTSKRYLRMSWMMNRLSKSSESRSKIIKFMMQENISRDRKERCPSQL